jgi:hypothetical protein
VKVLVALSFALATLGCGVIGGPGGDSADTRFGNVDGKLDGERFLAKDAEKAKKAGASPTTIVAVDAGAPGDRIAGLLQVPLDSCALIIARGSDEVEDIDLFAYGDDGKSFGSDERPDKTPTLLVCPPHPKRMYIVARIAAGHGLVAIGAQRVSEEDAPKVGEVLAARGFRGRGTPRLDSWPGLDAAVAGHRKAIGDSWQEVRRVAAPLDSSLPTRLSAVVSADRCLDVLVLPSEDVSHLDVAALDVDGRILGRASAHGRERFLVVCSNEKAPLTVEIRPQSGRGLAAVVMSESRGGALEGRVSVLELGPVGELAATREKHAEHMESRGYQNAKSAGSGTLAIGRRESVALDLAEGCTRIDVLVGKPARGLEAWLWNAAQELVAHKRGNAQATLFACGKRGRTRLDLEALARGGPFAIETRKESEAPAALVDNPLAASRLLSRMLGRGVIQRASQVTAAKVSELSPAKQEVLKVVVPLGRCMDVSVGLGPGATGAEVRLVDVANGQEIELGTGTDSAGARACALDGQRSLEVRAELRTVTGIARAVSATRMLSPSE